MGQSGSGAAVRCLSFHATYRCRNSGDCCTSRWPIPDDKGGFLPLNARGCAFHNAEAHRCEIHAALGHDALPLACRQFPRVSVNDPRGVSVALSCYCPTALGMLETLTGEIAIVENAPAFPPAGEYVGLDARASLPPALRPDVLMDWDSWWEWERRSVGLCNRDETLRQILRRLSAAVEHVRTWRPGQGELIDRVREAFVTATTSPGPEGPGLQTILNAGHERPGLQTILNAGPGRPGLRAIWRAGPSGPADSSGPADRAFLASHAFANWTAHLGEGLRTWLRSLETVVFLREAGWTVREIDLWLRHFADPRLLARAWSAAERE